MLLLDREGRVLALNAAGAALLGVQPPEPGTPLAEVLTGQPERLEDVYPTLRALLLHGLHGPCEGQTR